MAKTDHDCFDNLVSHCRICAKNAEKKSQQLEAENKRLREMLVHIKRVSMGHTYVDTREDINSQIVDQILKYIDANKKALEGK